MTSQRSPACTRCLMRASSSGLEGAFIIAELADEQSIVFLEDASGGRVAEGGPALSETALRFEALRSEALPKPASRDLIAKVAEERWTS